MKKLLYAAFAVLAMAILFLWPKSNSYAASSKYEFIYTLPQGVTGVTINGVKYTKSGSMWFNQGEIITISNITTTSSNLVAYVDLVRYDGESGIPIRTVSEGVYSITMPGKMALLSFNLYKVMDGKVVIKALIDGKEREIKEGESIPVGTKVTAYYTGDSSKYTNLNFEWSNRHTSWKGQSIVLTEDNIAPYPGCSLNCRVTATGYTDSVDSCYFNLVSKTKYNVNFTLKNGIGIYLNPDYSKLISPYTTQGNTSDTMTFSRKYAKGEDVCFELPTGYTALVSYSAADGREVYKYDYETAAGLKRYSFRNPGTTVNVTIEATGYTLSADSLIITCEPQEYTGNSLYFNPTVTTSSGAPFTDYSAYDRSSTDVGSHMGYIQFYGSSSEKKYFTYKVVPNTSGKGQLVGTYTYNGSVIKPEIKVTSNISSQPLTAGVDYDISYPKSINAGTYEATINFKGNYGGSKKVSYTINPKTSVVVTIKKDKYTYTGSAIIPELSVKDVSGTVLEKGRDYDIVSSAVKVGSASASVKFKGNYSSTKKVSFTIAPCPYTSITAKPAKENYSYTGKNIKAKVVAKDKNGNTLVEGKDYTVKRPSASKEIGSYKMTVTYCGNYTGKATVKFNIGPKNTSISSIKAEKSSITVNWKALTQDTNGYQIRYSLKSDMSSSKSVTVKGNTNSSYKISKLKSKKNYYVQIRTYKTIKGKNYYSDWSGKKTVKTK